MENLIRRFQKMYMLSEQGARDLLTAIGTHFLLSLAVMFPMFYAFYFLDSQLNSARGADSLPPMTLTKAILIALLLLVIMYVIGRIDYNATYTKIYNESAKSRIRLAETLRALPLAFFGQKNLSDLSATIMADATQVETLFSHAIPQLWGRALSILVIGLMMFLYNWRMAIAVFWVAPVAALIFFASYKLQLRAHAAAYAEVRAIHEDMQVALDNIQDIHAYNREATLAAAMDAQIDAHERRRVHRETLLASCLNISLLILKLGTATILLYGAHALAAGLIDGFSYIVFLLLSVSIYMPFLAVLNQLTTLLYLQNIIKRLKEIDEMPRQGGRHDFNPKGYDIVFDHVHFAYEAGRQTIEDLSFTARQGQVTALVGPSGGGKSTTAKLAARFWDIQSGTITIGGENIAEIDPETLLQSFSIVFQDVLLFNESVMENIRLGRKSASDEEVLHVARLARCDEFVARLPEGYQTPIGENGTKLSGGERQRISIARALLKDAPIVLLDEATASLDAENETLIQAALAELIRDKTVLVIAHRMRTVLKADQIIVLKEGRLQEQGRPESLLAQDGLFAQLYKAQMEH